MSTHSIFPIVRTSAMPLAETIQNICEKGEPTIIIACHSRARFIEQLLQQTTQPEVSPIVEKGKASDTADEEDIQVNPTPKTYSLLQPTLRLLSASSQVKVVFCPTIPTFRAYISILPIQIAEDGSNSSSSKLLILDILALHAGTSEFTVQGLSRSLASVASLQGCCPSISAVELIECLDSRDDMAQPDQSRVSWKTEVPLLSGSIKIGDAGQGFANRTVSISRFADRWFHFE